MLKRASYHLVAAVISAGLFTIPSLNASELAASGISADLAQIKSADALVFKGGVDPLARKRRHARIRAILFGPKGKKKK